MDRRALPRADASPPERETVFEAPRTPIEERLARMWAEVLHVDEIGIYDEFIDLGGHSLAAMQIVSRIHRDFRLELSPQSFRAAFTVAQAALMVCQHVAGCNDPEEVARMLSQLESLTEEEAQDRTNCVREILS